MKRSRYTAKKSPQLEALHSTFEENGILPDTVVLEDSLILDITRHADSVLDYHHLVSAR